MQSMKHAMCTAICSSSGHVGFQVLLTKSSEPLVCNQRAARARRTARRLIIQIKISEILKFTSLYIYIYIYIYIEISVAKQSSDLLLH
jgi:hypothetical protein